MSLSLGTTQISRLWALPTYLWQAVRDARRRMKRSATLQRELAHMDARMLSDIGVSRAQLQYEVDRKG
jgi:uncharacterized protein YjiS (DUF1127 family)